MCSRSVRDSSTRSTVERKLWQCSGIWKPIRSAPSSPSSNCACHGQMPNASGFGHGICQKIATRASGRAALIKLRQQREVIVLHKHQLAPRCPSSLQEMQRRTSRSRAGSSPSRQRERSAAYARYGTAATVPRLQIRRNNATPLHPRATPGAGYISDPRAARATDRIHPHSRDRRFRCHCATQTPSHARNTGSIAVTNPLGGTTQIVCRPCAHVHVRLAIRNDKNPADPAVVLICTASRSGVQKCSPASRSRASAAAAARAAIRLSAIVSTSRASGLKILIPRARVTAPFRSAPSAVAASRSATRISGRIRNQRTITNVTATISTTVARIHQKLLRQTS